MAVFMLKITKFKFLVLSLGILHTYFFIKLVCNFVLCNVCQFRYQGYTALLKLVQFSLFLFSGRICISHRLSVFNNQNLPLQFVPGISLTFAVIYNYKYIHLSHGFFPVFINFLLFINSLTMWQGV